jgi:hypothetical protein
MNLSTQNKAVKGIVVLEWEDGGWCWWAHACIAI